MLSAVLFAALAVNVQTTSDAVIVTWPDENSRTWRAEFALDAAKPLITSIGVGGKSVVERARPAYWVETGKRRGGWDQFFDFPPAHPDGTRRFVGELKTDKVRTVKTRTFGDRAEVRFDGLQMGVFSGGIAYTFYPGSRLIQQNAVASTQEPDTAYFYDTGLRMASDADRRPGNNMDSRVAYYDTQGQLVVEPSGGSERTAVAVRYRAIAARLANGSVVAFPAPHQYFFARDFTTNMRHAWHRAWRGEIAIGVRQLPDDNSPYYPWMNAPPGSEQRMSIFFLVSDRNPQAALDDALRYTNRDRFAPVAGFKTLASHWHFHYTVQAMEKGAAWTPPFKPVLKDMGVDAAMIMDFHGDGHPRDLTDLRLKELDAYYRFVRTQSDADFLLMPSEEANVHLGGHWTVTFPKPVYWMMGRPAGTEFRSEHPEFGAVYRVANAAELLDMVRREGGWMYQTHPRTKGSMGFPDKIRETEHFRDPRYTGAGWKAMPSDLSLPRLGERSLKLLDDMNNWGLRKRLIGEVDVFQIDHTHELYAHMNVNYVRASRLPAWNDYGTMLETLARGEYFITTGEVLLPEVKIAAAAPDSISVRAEVRWTFPLNVAEIVWSDGAEAFRHNVTLDTTRPFGSQTFEWKVPAKGWKWARLAVWDVAGNGAFINPIWR